MGNSTCTFQMPPCHQYKIDARQQQRIRDNKHGGSQSTAGQLSQLPVCLAIIRKNGGRDMWKDAKRASYTVSLGPWNFT